MIIHIPENEVVYGQSGTVSPYNSGRSVDGNLMKFEFWSKAYETTPKKSIKT